MLAVAVCDFVGGVDAFDICLRVLDDFAILNIDALDGREAARVRAVCCDELGDDGEWATCIDDVSLSVERIVAHAIGVEIAAILVTVMQLECGLDIAVNGRNRPDAIITIISGTAGSFASAHSLSRLLADVRREGSRDRVGFPDVHLVATRTV